MNTQIMLYRSWKYEILEVGEYCAQESKKKIHSLSKRGDIPVNVQVSECHGTMCPKTASSSGNLLLDCLDLLAYVKRKIFFRTFIFYFHHGFPENSLGLVLPWLMVFDRFFG